MIKATLFRVPASTTRQKGIPDMSTPGVKTVTVTSRADGTKIATFTITVSGSVPDPDVPGTTTGSDTTFSIFETTVDPANLSFTVPLYVPCGAGGRP